MFFSLSTSKCDSLLPGSENREHELLVGGFSRLVAGKEWRMAGEAQQGFSCTSLWIRSDWEDGHFPNHWCLEVLTDGMTEMFFFGKKGQTWIWWSCILLTFLMIANTKLLLIWLWTQNKQKFHQEHELKMSTRCLQGSTMSSLLHWTETSFGSTMTKSS